MSEKELREIFEDMREKIRIREAHLMQRLDEIAKRKRLILTTQLDDMSVALDNLRHCMEVAERLLANTEGVRGGQAYVLAGSQSIATRCDQIDEGIVVIPFEPQTDPMLRVSFIENEIALINTVTETLGAVLTRDNIPHDEDNIPHSQSDDDASPSAKKSAVDEKEFVAKSSEGTHATLRTRLNTGEDVTFTLRTRSFMIYML
jgi:hypothetical protein